MKAERLSELLRRAHRVVLLATATRAVGFALAIIFGAILLAFLLDAVLSLSPGLRQTINIGMSVLAIASAVYIARQIWRSRLGDRAVARLLEDRLGVRDSRLINAVDLSSRPENAASASLVEASVRGGDEFAAEVSPRSAVDGRPVRRALIALAGVFIVALILHLVLPGMFATVSRRYLDPDGAHRAYTMLQFEVTVEPEKVYHGGSARVFARLSGRDIPERANLVFPDEALGGTLPMLRRFDRDTLGNGEESPQPLYVMQLERLKASRQFYIDTPSGRSEIYTLEVLPVPLFEDIVTSYAFPAYTGWGSIRQQLEADGVRAITGTQVAFEISSNVPLREGWIELIPENAEGEGVDPPTRVRMEPLPEQPQTVIGRFDLAFDGRFRLSLVGADGTPGDEVREGRLAAAADRDPIVEITAPPLHLVVPEVWTVLVSIAARDDVGLQRLEISRAVNGWGLTSALLEPVRDRPGRATASYLFDLPGLGARAGDVITYHATAYDNHPGGGQFTDTETYVLEVITNEEYEEFARTQYRMDEIQRELDAFNRRLENLGVEREELLEELKKLQEAAEAGTLSESQQAEMQQIERALEAFSQEAAKLADDMAKRAEQESLYDFEEPLKTQLQEMSKQLEQQASNASNAAAAMPPVRRNPGDPSARQAMRDAIQKLQEEDEPFGQEAQQQRQQASDDLDALAEADRLAAQAERIRQIIFAQRDLADRLSAFRGLEKMSPAQALKAHRLAEQQDRLREALEEVTKELRETAKGAEERLPRMCSQANGICDKIGEMGVTSDQLIVAHLARIGLGDDAVEIAERTAENLETLLSDCSGQQMQQQASQDLDGCLTMPKNNVGNSLQQLGQSRGIPGIGQQGETGSGFSGSQARIMVAGPHVAGEGDIDEDAMLQGAQGAGRSAPGDPASGRPGAETLTPEASGAERIGAGTTWGVPVPYREEAEAYFRRLADESKER